MNTLSISYWWRTRLGLDVKPDQESAREPLWDSLLDVASVGKDTHFFEAGCGTGEVSARAALRGARVNGLDPNVRMVALARSRVPDGDFQLGNLAQMPYLARSFEVVFSINTCLLMQGSEAMLQELTRICTPGGRLLLAVEEAPLAIRAATDSLIMAPVNSSSPLLAASEALEDLVRASHLKVQSAGTITWGLDYLHSSKIIQALSTADVTKQPHDDEMVERLEAALHPFTDRMGGVAVVSRCHYILATPTAPLIERHTPVERNAHNCHGQHYTFGSKA